MSIIWLRSAIAHNRLRIVYLTLLFPALVLAVIFVVLFVQYDGAMTTNAIFRDEFVSLSGIGLIIVLIRMVISIIFQKQIIFSFTGARAIERKEAPAIYNIVENLCISRGLPTPKIGIIDDQSMNAFATGWSPKDSWIVFSKGLIERLDKQEIEAVAGHELTHIINGDVKTMVIVNVFIGVIGSLGYILMRTGGGSWKKKNPLPLIGLALYLLSYLLFPFINLAISRKKEYLADAGSVELTHDKTAMINALKKISTDSIIESVHAQSETIASMFFEYPKHQTWLFAELMSTHPPIEKRIAMLEKY